MCCQSYGKEKRLNVAVDMTVAKSIVYSAAVKQSGGKQELQLASTHLFSPIRIESKWRMLRVVRKNRLSDSL